MEEIDLNNFSLRNKIGEGSFGEVYKVKENSSGNIYAAKISLRALDKKLKKDWLSISREINIISQILHPNILKFIGFSSVNFNQEAKPVIITEYLPNGSLQDVISLERRSLATFDWSFTKKLVNIYGIAAAMEYLHKNKIVHRDLKPANILMDDFLCPKIADFGLSKIQHPKSSINYTLDSTLEIKGTPLYIAPEIWTNSEYSPASDVYAFGFIVYELLTVKAPFKDQDVFQIRDKILNGERPTIDTTIPDAYSNLIERCWSQDPKNRPSFKEIVELLKKDEEFTEELANRDDFLDYVEYIDNSKTEFDPNKKIIPIDKFLKRKSSTFQRISINTKFNDDDENEQKKFKSKSKSIYPLKEYMKLSKECKLLVDEAKSDPEKQFEVGIYLIEGENGFPNKTEFGIKYLEESIKNGNIDSATYYSRMLFKAELVPRDLQKAASVLDGFDSEDSPEVPVLHGLIQKKLGKFKEAAKFFEIASKAGNGEGQYEYTKLLYKGQGCDEDKEEANKLFLMAKRNGITKSEKFLNKVGENGRSSNKKIHSESKSELFDDDADELFRKAFKYAKGDEIPMNKAEAARYYKMAIEKGNSSATYNYAIMLYTGDGIPMNKAEAARYFKMAIEKGNSSATYNYAVMLKKGDGIPMNKAEAARYFKMAIEKGHSNAMNNYANMLDEGDGIPMNKAEAVRYFKMAIEKGDSNAMYNYAVMLKKGDGIPMNKAEAARYFKMAIEKGYSNAMNSYAVMLKNGDGIPMNKAEAVRYFKMAIEKGDSNAMYNYAVMLDEGDGIPMNKAEAARYFKMANK